ncbi:phage holin family protein [Riemerella columbipharyngis]|uniref:Bacteriophage holin family protein n=1 Tax=Riemerella columbipharyngis TaxID=1071918 RepID=A0A1G7FZG2_9FLAO|nr:phage holin family protein [Riemerella columbipharyngis]SDE81232.1 Bacteriophage holin family protein [Riemerella columbipharyngis]
MILDFLNRNFADILIQLGIVCTVWVAVLIAMIVDFIFGLRKARQLGEVRTSEGYRRSINKVVFYYSMMTFALLFDFLDVITPTVLPKPLSAIPLFSILGATALVFTEVKSVYEKGEDKLRRRVSKSAVDLMEVFLQNRDILENIANKINENKENEKEQANY